MAIVLLCAAPFAVGQAHAQTDEATKYKQGQAVEVKYEGNWVSGTYESFFGTEEGEEPDPEPHEVSFEFTTEDGVTISGTNYFSPADIRAKNAAATPAPTPQPPPATPAPTPGGNTPAPTPATPAPTPTPGGVTPPPTPGGTTTAAPMPPDTQPATPAPTAPVVGNTGSQISAQDANAMVAFHNEKRQELASEVGADIPPVTWSNTIAAIAQTRAEQLAAAKVVEHLPWPGQAPPYGENLFGGSLGFNAKNAAESWYTEKNLFQWTAPPMVFNDEVFNSGAGHYTQMIWKDTKQVGAGMATYENENGNKAVIIVCLYNPGGNVTGGSIY